MSSKVLSAALVGLDGQLVEVEAGVSGGLPKFFIVGLPDKAVDEARERVRLAIKNSGFEMPLTRLTINLAPADLKKAGPSYDLPIAISIIALTGHIGLSKQLNEGIFIGELALDGKLRSVNGVLSIALYAIKMGIKTIYLPKENAKEASLVYGLNIIAVENLFELVLHLEQRKIIKPYQDSSDESKKLFNPKFDVDMSHIKGQEQAKRALQISASGGHNILKTRP